MSIPLERLYHYIESTAQDIRGSRVLIYRFSPDGSKKIEDLTVLGALYGAQDNVSTPYERLIIPYIYCYDQEPLDYDLYKDYKQKPFPQPYINDIVENYQIDIPLSYFPEFHLNIYDHSILVHSEKRSSNLERYQQDNLIPAYYWSHALIARDWFRFAQHTSQRKQVKKTFLIYNRAWSGTREYRLKFAEHVIRLALETQCQTSINPIEPELNIHYDSHQFTNSEWRPSIPLENYFPISTAQSYYSADFDGQFTNAENEV